MTEDLAYGAYREVLRADALRASRNPATLAQGLEFVDIAKGRVAALCDVIGIYEGGAQAVSEALHADPSKFGTHAQIAARVVAEYYARSAEIEAPNLGWDAPLPGGDSTSIAPDAGAIERLLDMLVCEFKCRSEAEKRLTSILGPTT